MLYMLLFIHYWTMSSNNISTQNLLHNNYFHYLLVFKDVGCYHYFLLSLVVALYSMDDWFCRRLTGIRRPVKEMKTLTWKISSNNLLLASFESCLNLSTIKFPAAPVMSEYCKRLDNTWKSLNIYLNVWMSQNWLNAFRFYTNRHCWSCYSCLWLGKRKNEFRNICEGSLAGFTDFYEASNILYWTVKVS